MVRVQRLLMALLTVAIITHVFVASAQRQYTLEYEWVKIWINQDGTIDLLYSINITLDFGDDINYILVGQPQNDFTIGAAIDQFGQVLMATDASEGDDYRVRVNLDSPLQPGHTIGFNLTTNVARMIWQDEDNPGNVGMQFIPCWWSVEIEEMRVLVVLPPGVSSGDVRCTPVWDNAFNDPSEDNRLTLYWEEQNLQPDQKITYGVSFPKEYIEHYEAYGKDFDWLAWFLPAFAVVFIFLIAGVIVYKKPQLRNYSTPNMRIEALGIRHGLTAVEASYLLDLPPVRIITEILYSLLKKRAIWVATTTPAVKLEVMKPFKDQTGTPETPLRYYEKEFLGAVKSNGTLDEEKLAHTIMLLRDTVEKKLRGYCRRDTINYYKKVVGKAWEQVKGADTAELASKAYDENLLWLLLHDGFKSRTKDTFREQTFEPGINWWWYWYGYTLYHHKPTYKPSPMTTQPEPPPSIPGADFANNIAMSVEATTNSIVASIEKFTNSIIPAPPPSTKTSRTPTRSRASCACACAACACACACVSCACACASGGVG